MYLSVKLYAKKFNVSEIFVYQALAKNKIAGAVKMGKKIWRIPADAIIQPFSVPKSKKKFMEALEDLL